MWEFFFVEYEDSFVPHEGAVASAFLVGLISITPWFAVPESLRAGQLFWGLALVMLSGAILVVALAIPRRLIIRKDGLLYLSLFDWYKVRRTRKRSPRTFVPWNQIQSLKIYRDNSRGADSHARRAVLSARRRGNFEIRSRCQAWDLLVRRVAAKRPEIVRDASSRWWSFLQ